MAFCELPPASCAAFVLAVATALALLLVFSQLMRQAVEQGELRRRSTALYWQATWQCNALRGQDQRRVCLAQLRLDSHKADGSARGGTP